MEHRIAVDSCRSYIDCQMKRLESPAALRERLPPPPVVTISRQAGAGGVTVGQTLARYLQRHDPRHVCPWTVFDKDLVSKVVEDHHFERQVAEFMPEDKFSELQDAIEEFVGLHPSSWTLAQKTAQTILHLAAMGNAIIVGRGANLIIGPAPHAFHVRLVGSVAKRRERLDEYHHLSAAAALQHLKEMDRGRRRYIRQHFGQDIENPLLYHMILNTDSLSLDQAAAIIGEAVLHCGAV